MVESTLYLCISHFQKFQLASVLDQAATLVRLRAASSPSRGMLPLSGCWSFDQFAWSSSPSGWGVHSDSASAICVVCLQVAGLPSCIRTNTFVFKEGIGVGISFSLLLRKSAFSCHKDFIVLDWTVSISVLNQTLAVLRTDQACCARVKYQCYVSSMQWWGSQVYAHSGSLLPFIVAVTLLQWIH